MPAQGARRQRAAVVVVDKPPQILRKADGALVMKTVSTVEPTFLQRKAFNVFLQVAQRPANEDNLVYEVGFKEFEQLIGLSPNNRPHMRALVDRLTSVKVVFDYRGEGKKGSWGVANLLAEIYIDDDHRTIRYSFPIEMRQKLLDPAIYNRVDLSMQNLFSSYSSLALYEIVSRYFTYEGRRTFAEHWTTWSVLLSGAREPHATYREFNKMLSRAIEQVNTHCTQHEIQMRVTKTGLKVDQIWFVIQERAQSQLPDVSAPALASGELLARVKAMADDNYLDRSTTTIVTG